MFLYLFIVARRNEGYKAREFEAENDKVVCQTVKSNH